MKQLTVFILSFFLLVSVMVTCDAKTNEMNFPTDFKEFVKPPSFDAKFYRNGQTSDIMKAIRLVDKKDVSNLSHLVEQFKDGKQGLKDFHDFLIYHVQYVADPSGEQLIKTPERLLYDGEGDCKSYSLAIAAFCKLKGYKYQYECTSYSLLNAQKTHIYCTAILKGERIPIDPVYTLFEVVDAEGVANHKASIQLMKNDLTNKFGERKFFFHRTIMKNQISGIKNNLFVDVGKVAATAGVVTWAGHKIYKKISA